MTNKKQKSLSDSAQAYADASGGSVARQVKSQIYGVGKNPATQHGHMGVAPVSHFEQDERQIASTHRHANVRTDRTASASALPERIGADVKKERLVPQKAHVLAPEDAHKNNMWENLASAKGDENWRSIYDEHIGTVDLRLTDSGEIKTVMVRVASSTQACIIDWINFTVLEDTFFKTARQTLISDDEILAEASRIFEPIFGFGITAKRDRGLNFYRESWVLGDGMGFVCFGGQRATMLVMLNGQGCQCALPGWEKRLYDFLTKTAVRPSISRIDLAHDDFDGTYLSVDWALKQWETGGFSFRKGGRPPEEQCLGSWKRPSGKGRTFTVGQRSSSKFCRVYEKGKKEGDKTSPWCRFEIEFKNTNTLIPPEVLLDPTSFFVGAYPCIELFANSDTPKRMEVKQKAAVILMDAAEEWLVKQTGRYLRVFRELFGDKETLDKLCNSSKDYWPKRLISITSDHRTPSTPLHKKERINTPSFFHFIKTVPSFGLNGENGFA